jgi:hypothetical protein
MDDDAHSRGGALDNDAPSRDAETDEREGGESARDDASADEDPAAGQRPRRARGTRVICRLPDVEATRTQSEP